MKDHVDADAVVDLTSALVAVDTQNPPGRETPIAGVVRDCLSKWRPVWTEIEPEPGRMSLVAEIPHPEGPGDRPTLIVNGHLDVVPVVPDAWSYDPFTPTVEEGRLYGRGSADMKGGIAAAVCALDALLASGRAPGCDLVFHFVADEEVGGALGTGVLLERGLIKGDACLIPEPTSMQLCVAERGLLQGHVTVHGKPGHGSRPRDGVSAIERAARMVVGLHGVDFGAGHHHLLGRPTCNIGTIEGGNGLNVIAETCRFGVDRRLLPGATLEASEAELRDHIAGLGIEGLEYDFALKVFGEASELDPDSPFLDLLRTSIALATGVTPEVIGMSFTTDARFVRNGAGVPAVVCGPGNVEQTHAVDEWVGVDRLVDATASYAELYASFGADA